jgi:hypothetical protein
MTARQFGFVIARALAILCLLYALNQSYMFFGAWIYGRPGNVLGKLLPTGIIGAFLLMGTFLWAAADRFAGDIADSQPTIRGGNWVVRLTFTTLGILIVLSSLDPIVSAAVNLMNQGSTASFFYPILVASGIKCMVGIGLIAAYRFDKTAALQAAQASIEATQ